MSSDSMLSSKGSRYQAEKTLIIVIYAFVAATTFWWVIGSRNLPNALGASATFEKVGPLESPTFFIKNESGGDWTKVRVAVDKKYLYTVERVKEDDTLVLRPEDFTYYYFIPRPWGRETWESLQTESKPGRNATEKLSPKLIEIHSEQGSHKANF